MTTSLISAPHTMWRRVVTLASFRLCCRRTQVRWVGERSGEEQRIERSDSSARARIGVSAPNTRLSTPIATNLSRRPHGVRLSTRSGQPCRSRRRQRETDGGLARGQYVGVRSRITSQGRGEMQRQSLRRYLRSAVAAVVITILTAALAASASAAENSYTVTNLALVGRRQRNRRVAALPSRRDEGAADGPGTKRPDRRGL